jgi:peptide/nickel transport system ATP-binding protein
MSLLSVEDLRVHFATRGLDNRLRIARALNGVSFNVEEGEVLGLVGETGAGKSLTALALLGLLQPPAVVTAGRIRFEGRELDPLKSDVRGTRLTMIPQSPHTSLDPLTRIGDQLVRMQREHRAVSKAGAWKRAAQMLEEVRIPAASERLRAWPHELSGGMAQRVLIAMALVNQPRLVIADEPTTGLDVTTQKAVMDLIVELTRQRGMSSILITHDLGLAATYCDRVTVMQKGRVVESAPSRAIFTAPEHPYTQKLMRATPRAGVSLRELLPDEGIAGSPAARVLPLGRGVGKAPLLVVEKLVKEYPRQGATKPLAAMFRRGPAPESETFRAVDGISFSVGRGESVGLVGESGCGKSTTSMMVMRLIDQTGGLIQFDGEDIGAIPASKFARLPARKRIQMVFQDATDSLNPRFTAARAIADPILRLGDLKGRSVVRGRCEQLAQQVGLPLDLLDRFPHQLSGGQKARVGIARAIALNPDLVILDEPTAALDVSVQAVVLNLLQDLKESLGMSYLFVSHDLNVVRLLCDRVLVMRAGRIVEQGPTEIVLYAPKDD